MAFLDKTIPNADISARMNRSTSSECIRRFGSHTMYKTLGCTLCFNLSTVVRKFNWSKISVITVWSTTLKLQSNRPFPHNWMMGQLDRWITPHLCWQYFATISGVEGKTGNMSVLSFEPAGTLISVQTYKIGRKIDRKPFWWLYMK